MRPIINSLRSLRRKINGPDPAQIGRMFAQNFALPQGVAETMSEADLLAAAQQAAYPVADLIARAALVTPSPKTAMFYTIVAAVIRGELDDDFICLLDRGSITPRAEFLEAMILALAHGHFNDDLARFINGAKAPRASNPSRSRPRSRNQARKPGPRSMQLFGYDVDINANGEMNVRRNSSSRSRPTKRTR